MAGAKTESSTSASAVRIRENQRRSRARRKEYVESMERKVKDFERRGVEATLEMQQAARTVAIENARLRMMLARMGASTVDVDDFLQSFQEQDAARALESVRLQGLSSDPPDQDIKGLVQPKPDETRVGKSTGSDDGHHGHNTTGPDSARCSAATAAEANATYHPLPPWVRRPDAAAVTPFDKLDVLALASMQQGSCDGMPRSTGHSSADSRADSPSTAGASPGAITPSSNGPHALSPRGPSSFASPVEMSCNAAAQIIAEMQGYGQHRELVQDELGCHGQSKGFSKSSVLFHILEREGHL
ncbi:hypothetical protein DCS_02840 [Drechmeria coniospora]|uniref:BZIP domain-containing protein n=1 Tax=Drechmeria coniospora TaxID=98403 RepID=A0A151GX65_DRECN|nr:hypothetical protein DCS_02840 [Drechmeria coniospora]KYK61697.1 hypothetical protein DCS_02840 [Drechmeria coniospora]ODA82495.1 hypothetical protein RJ55_01002 [Drechmeria coniospora]